MDDVERKRCFDVKKAFKRYGRDCKPGEIGCTLSHQKCYKKLVNSNDECVLILEDDVVLADFEEEIFKSVEEFVSKCNKPIILLLSGNYWFLDRKKKWGTHDLVSVYDAYGTFAYMVNKKAAKKLLIMPASFLADDWRYLKSQGIRLMALYPHLIDSVVNSEMPSTIFAQNRPNRGMKKNNLSIANCLNSYIRGGMRYLLSLLGRYEQVG